MAKVGDETIDSGPSNGGVERLVESNAFHATEQFVSVEALEFTATSNENLLLCVQVHILSYFKFYSISCLQRLIHSKNLADFQCFTSMIIWG